MENNVSFSPDVVSTDEFHGLPIEAQCLYFHLMMESGAKGILNNPVSIARAVMCNPLNLKILIDNGYLKQISDTEVQIVHYYQNLTSDKEQRQTYAYSEWRKACLKRDRCCVNCGSTEHLVVHHIKPFALYPELRTDINNGMVLCDICHRKLHGLYKR